MSRWFAAPAGLPLEGGYFYLCPPCFEETIEPHLDELLDVLREHLPAPTRGGQTEQPGAAPPPQTGNTPPAAAPPAGSEAPPPPAGGLDATPPADPAG